MTDFSTYQTQLSEEKERLEEELGTVGKPAPTSASGWEAVQTETTPQSDPNDQASQLDEYQENRAITDVLTVRYKEVTEALARLENGTYGICTTCGEAIEPERLAADPAATTCKAHLA